MKFYYQLSIVILFMGIGQVSFSQSVGSKKIIKETIHVHGACLDCKKRIEKAARIKGVRQAIWDKEQHALQVIYRSDKTSRTNICQSVADIGHDTDEIKASDEVYHSLPDCCHYRTVANH